MLWLLALLLSSSVNGFPLREQPQASLPLQRPNIANGVVASAGPVSVAIGLTMLNVDVDAEGLVTAHVWINLAWEDARLAWKPEDYGNITAETVSANKIWIPDIAHYSSYDANGRMQKQQESSVNVAHDGSVTFVDDKMLRFKCDEYFSGNRSNAVWDSFECSIKFGSWALNGNDLDLTVNGDTVDTSFISGASSLQVLSSALVRHELYYECCPEPYIDVEVHFVFQRAFVAREDGLIEWNKHSEP